VVVHPDHHECGVRRNLRQVRDRLEPGVAQYCLLDDDDRRREPPEQPHQLREIGGRRSELDSGLVFEQPRQRGSHTLVARGDEDRDR
jgi:hypothetical protein